MDNTGAIFSKESSINLGQVIWQGTATVAGVGQVTINLHQKALVQISSKGKLFAIYDFDLKWSFSNLPSSITFQKGQQKLTYLIKSNDLVQWRQALRKKLNQRGFHQQFKPKKKIGKGNFASVYLAQKSQTGRSYAVKAFSKQAAYSEDKGKQCLIKEIQVMRQLCHKNCMQLYEVFQSDNSLYIVVQLLEGGQLYDKVKAKYKFKPAEVRMIVKSILQGLQAMHAKKIMHRDLKPQNLIFRSQGSFDCVIADFGLAQFSDAQQYLFVRCGTPGYVAPEVINIKDMKTKYHPICDIFSLGLIFHLLVLGVSAFPGKTYNQVLSQNRASNITLDTEIYKGIDATLLDLMNKMLKKNPTQRISASQALKHPYFDGQYEDIEMNVVDIKNSYPNCDSPLLTSNNPNRKELTKKDSCVDFKMGKQNVFTGKVETVAQTGTPNSVNKRMQSFASPKVSKFGMKQ